MKTRSGTMLRNRRHVVSQQFINGKSGLTRKTLQQIRRCGTHAVDQLRDGWLAHPHSRRQCRLRGVRAREPIAKCLHMVSENIRLPYNSAIGSPYTPIQQNREVSKPKERSFLERALEALQRRYPRERATQVRLAKIAGVSQPAAREWGLPDRAPDHARVLKIAKETGVCVEWLYTERGPMYPPQSPEADPFLKEWANLDPATRGDIERYRDFLLNNPSKRQ